jgi:hypothetical protein
MSEFVGGGFAPFPDSYHDNLNVRNFSALNRAALEYKTDEYGAFMQRTDLMPRARAAGERILEHLIFELAYLDGVYDDVLNKKLEEEFSECA